MAGLAWRAVFARPGGGADEAQPMTRRPVCLNLRR